MLFAANINVYPCNSLVVFIIHILIEKIRDENSRSYEQGVFVQSFAPEKIDKMWAW